MDAQIEGPDHARTQLERTQFTLNLRPVRPDEDHLDPAFGSGGRREAGQCLIC